MLTMTITHTDGSEERLPAPEEAVALWVRFPLVRTAWHTKPTRLVLRRDSHDRGLVVEYCWADGHMVPFWLPYRQADGSLVPPHVAVPLQAPQGSLRHPFNRGLKLLARNLWVRVEKETGTAASMACRFVITDQPPQP